MRPSVRSGLLLSAFAAGMTAYAQTAVPPAVDAALTKTLVHLAELAAAEKINIPTFECTATGVSTLSHGGTMLQHVTFTATIQARRNEKGSLEETVHMQTIDGQPWVPGGPRLPLYVEDAFSKGLAMFGAATQACKDYSLSRGRINFTAKPAVETISGCETPPGLRGYALLNSDGDVTHFEEHLPRDVAAKLNLTTFSSSDFKPVELNGKVHRLVSSAVAESPKGEDMRRFYATYNMCHQFVSSSTLGTAHEIPSTEPDASAPK